MIRAPRAILRHRAAELRRQQHRGVVPGRARAAALRPPNAASSAASRAASWPLAPPSLKWVSHPVVSNTATWGPSSWRRNRAAACTTSAYCAPGLPRLANRGGGCARFRRRLAGHRSRGHHRVAAGAASPPYMVLVSAGPLIGNRFRRERLRQLLSEPDRVSRGRISAAACRHPMAQVRR